METASLLNIKSTMRQSTDVVTGQALSMVSSAKNTTDIFKSELKNQMNKKSDDVQAKKDLPQNGKELPEKKIDADKREQNDAAKKADSQETRKLVKNTEQTNETDIKDQQSSSQENNSDSQNNNLRDNTQDNAQENKLASENSADASSAENDQQEALQSMSVAEQLEAVNAIDTKIADSLIIEEQFVRELADKNNALQDSAVVVNNDELRLKANIGQVEVVKVLHDNNRLSALANAVSTASATTPESKNESPLSKSIADFQQFIDMSKKFSTAGETIASVKNFEQGMKNELFNAQLLINESKPVAAQNTQTTAVSGQAISLDRIGFQSGNSLSFSQTISTLEVKTPVGNAGWNKNFSSQIMMMANNGLQQAKITLNPQHLGPVEAMVRLSGETAVVQLSSAHLSTKDALESAIPRLKEMLNENGFSQVDVNVSQQDKQQQEAGLNAKNGSNNEHGNSTMPGDEQLSEQTSDSGTDTNVTGSDQQGLNIVDYYA